MLSGPMRDRFKMHEHLEFYSVEELAKIVRVNAAKLKTPITDDAALELARRSRGTPRIANARLYWARNYAAAQHDGTITQEIARAALDMAEVDREGLDKQDRRYLETLIDVFGGGPTGVEALAATMNLAADTLTDEIEPYLLREQFIVRTPRGRVATPQGLRAAQAASRSRRQAAGVCSSKRGAGWPGRRPVSAGALTLGELWPCRLRRSAAASSAPPSPSPASLASRSRATSSGRARPRPPRSSASR